MLRSNNLIKFFAQQILKNEKFRKILLKEFLKSFVIQFAVSLATETVASIASKIEEQIKKDDVPKKDA